MVTFFKIIVHNKQKCVFGRNIIITIKYIIGKYNHQLNWVLVICTVHTYQMKELLNFLHQPKEQFHNNYTIFNQVNIKLTLHMFRIKQEQHKHSFNYYLMIH